MSGFEKVIWTTGDFRDLPFNLVKALSIFYFSFLIFFLLVYRFSFFLFLVSFFSQFLFFKTPWIFLNRYLMYYIFKTYFRYMLNIFWVHSDHFLNTHLTFCKYIMNIFFKISWKFTGTHFFLKIHEYFFTFHEHFLYIMWHIFIVMNFFNVWWTFKKVEYVTFWNIYI